MLKGCVSCASLATVKKLNGFGDGRLSSGRDPIGGGKAQSYLHFFNKSLSPVSIKCWVVGIFLIGQMLRPWVARVDRLPS